MFLSDFILSIKYASFNLFPFLTFCYLYISTVHPRHAAETYNVTVVATNSVFSQGSSVTAAPATAGLGSAGAGGSLPEGDNLLGAEVTLVTWPGIRLQVPMGDRELAENDVEGGPSIIGGAAPYMPTASPAPHRMPITAYQPKLGVLFHHAVNTRIMITPTSTPAPPHLISSLFSPPSSPSSSSSFSSTSSSPPAPSSTISILSITKSPLTAPISIAAVLTPRGFVELSSPPVRTPPGSLPHPLTPSTPHPTSPLNFLS